MESLSDALRREVAHMGISVSVIEPAFVRSAIFGKADETKQKDSPCIREEGKDSSWPFYDRFRTPKKLEQMKLKLSKADDPIVTSVVIHHAIADPKPYTRYPVANFGGIPAYFLTFIVSFIPDRVLDYALEL